MITHRQKERLVSNVYKVYNVPNVQSMKALWHVSFINLIAL